jgi:6-phosphogluconolactonase
MAMTLYDVFVGTYSPAAEPGIHWLRFDAGTGRLMRIGGTAGIDNPSFLTVDEGRRLLFAVSETDEGAVVSYRFDPASGTITELNRQPTYGSAPCYVSFDATCSRLLLVNYSSGSVALYPVHADGTIGEIADRIVHHGSGVRPDRQKGPHPHSIVKMPGGPYWLVPDLGTDTLYVYRHDPEKKKLVLHGQVRTEPGAGPRHAAFHPTEPYVYVTEELSSTIASYRYDGTEGTLTPARIVRTLPDNDTGGNTCADIHLDRAGSFLYGSNRGHDSIAVFRVLEQGELKPLGHVPTGGRTPRNFTLVPGAPFLLAANQDSDSIVVFDLSAETGMPEPNGHTLTVRKPVCLQVLTAPSK